MRILRCRRGLSLAEVAIVIALLGVIGAAIGSVLLHQQRFHGDASELLEARQGVRDAMEVLSTDIRGSSAADTLRLMADSAVELFSSIGVSVVCRTASSSAFALAEESAGSNTLSSFLVHPDSGDIALLYRDSADASGRGSHWERHRIAGFRAGSGGGGGGGGGVGGCLLYGSAPVEGFVLTLQGAPNGSVNQGAAVRFVRRGRYSIYRSSDREWYLGYRRCNALGPSICGSIQPVSGPYRRYSPDSLETGFLFEYFDEQGHKLTPHDSPLLVARIGLTSRTKGPRLRRIGNADRSIADSATASVAIRNR